MDREVKVGGYYRHFKGGIARVVLVAKHSETDEDMVVYLCTGCGSATNHKDGFYARPMGMFLSEVDHEKYPEVTQKYRFEEIEDEEMDFSTT